MDTIYVKPGKRPAVVQGTAGLATQIPGGCITADAVGYPLGGDRRRSLSQVAIDKK